MAYKQKGCTPVTAKVQKTTKGGMVQQPLLNMGAPVKMKMTSPAKQSGRPRVAAKPKAEEKQSEFTNLTFKQYRESGLIKPGDEKFYKGSGTKRVKTADISKNKNKKDVSIEKVAGGYFGNTLGEDKPKDSNRIDFPIEPKKDNKKETNNVIKRKKVEAIKPNAEAKTVSMETKSEPVGSIVLPNKPVQVKNVEKAVKKIDVAENKETRATKVRAKGEKALAEGNKDKALRLKRREERILKRAQKKRSQASKAIEPN
jgi:hypothetical protein